MNAGTAARFACVAVLAFEAPANASAAATPAQSATFRAQAALQYQTLLDWHRVHAHLDDGAVSVRVQRIFPRLVAATAPDQRDWAWEAHVTSDAAAAALSMAGGKLLIGGPYVARLDLDDGELAMLLAHEMAHAIAGHVRRRPSAGFGGDPAEEVRESQLAIGQEMEADDIGMALALRAGWKAAELLGFFDKLAAGEPAGTFSSSHPSASARAAHARERLGEVAR